MKTLKERVLARCTELDKDCFDGFTDIKNGKFQPNLPMGYILKGPHFTIYVGESVSEDDFVWPLAARVLGIGEEKEKDSELVRMSLYRLLIPTKALIEKIERANNMFPDMLCERDQEIRRLREGVSDLRDNMNNQTALLSHEDILFELCRILNPSPNEYPADGGGEEPNSEKPHCKTVERFNVVRVVADGVYWKSGKPMVIGTILPLNMPNAEWYVDMVNANPSLFEFYSDEIHENDDTSYVCYREHCYCSN